MRQDYIPMSEEMERRTWSWYKWIINARKTKVYADVRVWTDRSGYRSMLYPAYALPWNRPPKPRRKP